MAPQPNYNEGVASVTPDATPPSDYQNIRSDPGSFGGLIAEGEDKLGAGATKAGTFFGQVAADNASNDFQDFATKLLHGDPNKMVPGPDGQMVPDTGYLGLRGRAALDARPNISKAIDDQLKSTRDSLTTPEQQLQFDNFSKRYRSMVDERVGTHADGQATTWYQSVNTATAKLALDHIALNANDPMAYSAGEADLVHAYVKNAQLQGAQPGDPQYQEAVSTARRDALKARLDAVAVKDPSQAQAILDKPENKAIAGQHYDNMSSSYRGRAKQQQGYDVSDQYIKKSYENNPAINPVVLTNAGAQYGVSGSYLMRVQQMETGGNPNQTSKTGAQGAFQFVPSTAQKYGLKNPFDYAASADAAAHFAADNKVTLTSALGRPPSDQELYLAHNQGAEGAALLLAHPNQRAGDLVGDRAIRVNGGDPNAPAAAFTSMLSGKFNNAPVAATTNRKNQVIGEILANPDLDPDVREHAIRHAEQTFTAQAIAEEQDAKSIKAHQDTVQAQFSSRIVKGDTNGIIGQIADAARSESNPNGLDAAAVQSLYKFAVGDGGVSDPLQYGPSYSDALKRVLATPEAPGRIDGPRDIIQMGADGTLTKRGVDELLKTQKELQANPDSAGVTRTKSAQLDYYKSQFSIDQEMTLPGMKPYKSQKGLDKFNHEFVPAFESAYSQWVASGKNGMDFLKDKKQLDGIMDSVYPPSQRAADAISSEGGGVDDHQAPPPPQGVEAKAWTKLMTQAPYKSDGSQWSMKDWGGPTGPVAILRQNPSPQNVALFNQHFGDYAKAEDVLKAMPPKGYVAPAAAAEPPAVQTQPGQPSLLRRGLDNALHYGKTGHAPATGDEGDSPAPPMTAQELPLDKIIRENQVKPEPERRAEVEANPMTERHPVTVGIRG